MWLAIILILLPIYAVIKHFAELWNETADERLKRICDINNAKRLNVVRVKDKISVFDEWSPPAVFKDLSMMQVISKICKEYDFKIESGEYNKRYLLRKKTFDEKYMLNW